MDTLRDSGPLPRMRIFSPDADTRAFRDALGSFATGVTVVTAQGPDGPVGITANSFASVSLDPPLVLWSPAKASSRYAAFAQAQHFAIHVLAEDQRVIADAFTRAAEGFNAAVWAEGPQDVPLIEGCLARFECTQMAAHDAGDHLIVVGQVVRAAQRRGVPLLFQGGRYGGFAGDEG
jgi:flavin reductase (DIM6/NTAB) family NADH-FMN oxidoreductase RutF